MGNCCSCQSRSGETVKLILQDGQLKEFSQPVKVSEVLEEIPGYFVCNSDEMEFGSIFSEVDSEEELWPGQLYFALPKDSLNSPIRPAELASLAVKASLAMDMGGGDRCGCIRRSRIDPMMALTPYGREMRNDDVSVECRCNGRKDGTGDRVGGHIGNGRPRSIGMGRASFSSSLSIIPEEFD